LDIDPSPVPQQRLFHHTRVRKLVRQCPRAIRLFRQQILNYSRMSPSKQFVQVAKLLVKLVVFRRPDQDRVRQTDGLLPNSVRQSTNPRIRTNPFAVYDTSVHKFARDPPVDVRTRDHEGHEKIALATLIYSEEQLE